MNNTHVTLLPKCDNEKRMADFGLISLCNQLSKLISKVKNNKLNSVISECVWECQIAFISGKSIINNIIIVFEVLQNMKSGRR